MNRERVTITYAADGKQYSADWWVEKDWLYVSHSTLGTKSAKAGPAPAALAPILLREIVYDARR